MEEELNLLNKNLADRYKKSLSFFGASEKEEVNQVLRSVLDSVDTWDLSRSEKDSEKIFIVEDLMNRLSGVQSVRELTDSVRTMCV